MLSQRSSSGMQERWAVLLREEPSSKDYREAVSSNSGYVSARSRQTVHKAIGDRVGHRSYDRDGGRRCFEVPDHTACDCIDHVRLLADYLAGKLRIMRSVSLAGVPLND